MKDYKSDKIKIQEKIKGIENKLKNNKLDLRGYYIEVRSIVEELDKTLIPEYFPSFSKMVPSFFKKSTRKIKNPLMMLKFNCLSSFPSFFFLFFDARFFCKAFPKIRIR